MWSHTSTVPFYQQEGCNLLSTHRLNSIHLPHSGRNTNVTFVWNNYFRLFLQMRKTLFKQKCLQSHFIFKTNKVLWSYFMNEHFTLVFSKKKDPKNTTFKANFILLSQGMCEETKENLTKQLWQWCYKTQKHSDWSKQKHLRSLIYSKRNHSTEGLREQQTVIRSPAIQVFSPSSLLLRRVCLLFNKEAERKGRKNKTWIISFFPFCFWESKLLWNIWCKIGQKFFIKNFKLIALNFLPIFHLWEVKHLFLLNFCANKATD